MKLIVQTRLPLSGLWVNACTWRDDDMAQLGTLLLTRKMRVQNPAGAFRVIDDKGNVRHLSMHPLWLFGANKLRRLMKELT